MRRIVNTLGSSLDPETPNPFLRDAFRPNRNEWDADTDDLEVIGEIPRDLNGIYVRNTHNQLQQPTGIYQ
jgi:carotenoid cleavage dioxygenase